MGAKFIFIYGALAALKQNQNQTQQKRNKGDYYQEAQLTCTPQCDKRDHRFSPPRILRKQIEMKDIKYYKPLPS